MKDKFLNFQGLYGDNSILPIQDFIHHEPLIERSGMYNWEINEHLHTDLVQFFFINAGNGILISGKEEIVIQDRMILMIPVNNLHGFKFENNIEGDVLTISNSIFENLLKNQPKIHLALSNITAINGNLEPKVFENIYKIKEFILDELNSYLPEKQLTIHNYFLSMLIGIYRLKILENKVIPDADNKTLMHFQTFHKNVLQNLLSTKTIQDYAQELNITTVHLNRVCKAVVGKAPFHIIQELKIAEAKKYLLNTSYSISEVSYLLNIDDPAYFTRMFKTIVGVSPREFRKS